MVAKLDARIFFGEAATAPPGRKSESSPEKYSRVRTVLVLGRAACSAPIRRRLQVITGFVRGIAVTLSYCRDARVPVPSDGAVAFPLLSKEPTHELAGESDPEALGIVLQF